MRFAASPRPTVSGWRRHPLLWAEWLSMRNAARRFMEDRRRVVLWIGAGAVVAAILGFGVMLSPDPSAHAFQFLSEYRVLVIVALGLYGALVSNASRMLVEKAHAESWLASTPLAPRHVHRSITIVGTLPLIGRCLAGAATIAVLGLLARRPITEVAELAAACAGGMIGGVLVGWWLPRTLRTRGPDDARYLAAPEPHAGVEPRLDALAVWPLAQTRTWSRPENARLILVAALFGVQGGSSALHGLCVVATWLIAAYLSGLLAALVRTGREAATWLRSTPISFARFAWPLARRVLLHQALGTFLAMIAIVLLGAPVESALYCGVLWLTTAALVATISLAESYRGRSPGLKLVLSLSALAGVEIRQHGWSIPLALVLIGWHLRRRSHA